MRATALIHALRLIQLVADRQTIRFSQLKKVLPVSAPTLSAILQALEQAGFIRREPDGYTLGMQFLALSGRILQRFDLRTLARETLDWLCQQTGETAELVQPHHGEILYIDQRESPQAIRLFAQVGSRYKTLHASAPGKVILAFMTEPERREFYKTVGLISITPHTITQRTVLERQLTRIREDRLAYDIGECREEVMRLAAPIFNHQQVLTGVIGIAGPRYRIDRRKREEFGHYVRQAGQMVSSLIGSQPIQTKKGKPCLQQQRKR